MLFQRYSMERFASFADPALPFAVEDTIPKVFSARFLSKRIWVGEGVKRRIPGASRKSTLEHLHTAIKHYGTHNPEKRAEIRMSPERDCLSRSGIPTEG
jgi:hypothetical protein